MKILSVIFDRQIPSLLVSTEPDQGVARSAVLPHVDQSLLHNPEDFPAYALRHIQIFKVGDESCTDPCLSLKTFDRIVQNSEQPLRIDVNRFQRETGISARFVTD